MPRHVLIPFDGTPQAEAALTFAVEEWPDAAFTLLYAIDPVSNKLGWRAIHGGSETWYEQARESARAHFDEARAVAERAFDTRIEIGDPARVIVDAADEDPIDHVALGSHGRDGVSRILLGSVAESVVRRSPVPVTVVR
jgi:nucleotide-binding universal stress UspA family protein